MAALAVPLAVVGGLFSIAGTMSQASALRNQAAAEQQAANYKVLVENQRAMAERASAQRQALQTNRKTDLTQSALQARAAASGGGADDPTVVKLASDIEGEGKYQSLFDMYLGETRARGLEDQGVVDRFSADQRAKQLNSTANATILSGIGSLASRFAGGGGSLAGGSSVAGGLS